MDLSFLLLSIISRLDGERTINAGLHLFRGKRSGQTLQDVEYYNLKDFFCILPKLRIELFDEAVERLKTAGYISIDRDSVVHVTDRGWTAVNSLPTYRFNGWDYRGREHFFFARLSLVVQTLSHFKVGEKSFVPLQQDYEVQLFVKQLLYKQPISEASFSRRLGEELYQAIDRSGMEEVQKTILSHRLGGFESTGWTWNQLADELNISPMSVRLHFIESLHMVLETIIHSSQPTFLNKIAENIKVTTYLTESSMITKKLLETGMTMEEIATSRRLKLSTIEDHFVEMAIHDRDFPIERFVSNVDMELVLIKSKELGTKRLRFLKNEFPSLSYFQLRIILGAQSKGDETKWTSIKS